MKAGKFSDGVRDDLNEQSDTIEIRFTSSGSTLGAFFVNYKDFTILMT